MRWLWSLEDSGRKIQRLAQVLQIFAVVIFVLSVVAAGIWTIVCMGKVSDIIGSYYFSTYIGEYITGWFLGVISIIGGGFLFAIYSLVTNLFIHAFGSLAENVEAILYNAVEKDIKE